MKLKLLMLVVFFLLFITRVSYNKEVAFTQEDRERLIKMEATLEEFKNSVDKRFEQIDRRFEQVDRRFIELREDMNKRFEQVDKRFEENMNYMWMLIMVFIGITGVTIGFAIWDRRSMVKPFEEKVKDIEEELMKDRKRLHEFVEAFKVLAKRDEKVAEVLKELKLL